eukprot:NODE_3951_length_712_cov_73.636501_g3339_i0.p2 GENE.NODE_3951_length_712_cov_73.636501_g3339_i0~~NODE_3951_length_712_cov_73.636501_g3339_i0.p2  ORF type:complete len:149 (+),score=34.29 NODE_3951_length_712_cov_73.636501_g3339_i0:210-656(+)
MAYVCTAGMECPFGDACNYAHGEHELLEAGTPMQQAKRQKVAGVEVGLAPKIQPERYKTKMCANLQQQGFCRFGDNCAFAHGQHELQVQAPQQQFPDPNALYQSEPGGEVYADPNQQYADPNQQYADPNQQYADPSQQYVYEEQGVAV